MQTKKLNTSKKGRDAELAYAKILEDRGLDVFVVPKSNRWTKNKDIWGLFDIIACSVNEVLGVQVKCNNTAGAVKQLSVFKSHPACLKKMVAVRYDDGKWKEVWVR